VNQKGAIVLIAPLVFLLIIAIILFFLISQGIIKNPLKSLSLPGQPKESTISLQKQYQNPFDKDTQYVNPFSSYQNPFDTLK